MEVFPGTLLVHRGNTCSWTQVPCPPEAFPPGKEAWCSQYAVYTANCTKKTGAWQKFMYNPKHIINQHKQIKFHERNTSTHKSTMTNHNQPTPQKVRLTTTYNHHHKTIQRLVNKHWTRLQTKQTRPPKNQLYCSDEGDTNNTYRTKSILHR